MAAAALRKTRSWQRAGLMVHAPDLPGHGRANPSHDPAAYADLAGSLSAVLPAGQFEAVGFSLGAKLVLELALRLPGRLARAVLGGIGDNLFAPERVASAAATALESGVDATTPLPVQVFLREWDPLRNDAKAIAAVLRRPPNPVFTLQRLRAATLPLRVINGAADPVAAQSLDLAAALPQAGFAVLPGVGHFDLPRSTEFRRLGVQFLCAPDPAT
jgi:pimeloyl-ACP methyl ester carboxylesterase